MSQSQDSRRCLLHWMAGLNVNCILVLSTFFGVKMLGAHQWTSNYRRYKHNSRLTRFPSLLHVFCKLVPRNFIFKTFRCVSDDSSARANSRSCAWTVPQSVGRTRRRKLNMPESASSDWRRKLKWACSTSNKGVVASTNKVISCNSLQSCTRELDGTSGKHGERSVCVWFGHLQWFEILPLFSL